MSLENLERLLEEGADSGGLVFPGLPGRHLDLAQAFETLGKSPLAPLFQRGGTPLGLFFQRTDI